MSGADLVYRAQQFVSGAAEAGAVHLLRGAFQPDPGAVKGLDQILAPGSEALTRLIDDARDRFVGGCFLGPERGGDRVFAHQFAVRTQQQRQ